jgi:hypothetical protein
MVYSRPPSNSAVRSRPSSPPPKAKGGANRTTSAAKAIIHRLKFPFIGLLPLFRMDQVSIKDVNHVFSICKSYVLFEKRSPEITLPAGRDNYLSLLPARVRESMG